MASKQRLKQLEKHAPKNDAQKIVVMYDGHNDGLAKFDGIEMTQAKAEKKAAELSDSILLLRIKYASMTIQEAA
jgi:hypothetical protein